MKKAVLKSYAKLIVRSGLAVKPGQPVIIKANVDQEAFAAMVAKECYNAGASRVVMSWQSEKLNRIDLKKGHLRPFMKNLPQELAYQQWFTEALPCYLWLNSDDPDALKGTNPKKAGKIRAAKNEEVKSLIKARENRYQWCIAAIPSEKWAKKVFPHLNKAEGIKKLWEAILVASRAYEGDPIANWEDHDHTLKQKCAKLNSLQLKSLHYTSSNGTDLTVGLNPDVIWLGGGETTVSGAYFQPNIPSEECFTSPIKGQAEGIVYASKPLAYQGHLVKDFWIRFHEGKAVEVGAEQGKDVLESIIALDEGAGYLGECALVPFNSPINNTGILFYNTLFDENAACHLAIGRGFTNLYPNHNKYTDEQLESFGINSSMSHVDFMIGNADLKIVGTTVEGKEVTIFEDGNWAI